MDIFRNPKCLLWRVGSPKRIKANAYLYASEGQYSREIDTLTKIDRFGIEAITGRRQFYHGELRRLVISENIVNAYRSRQASDGNWAAWANQNERMAAILAEAEKLGLNQ